MSNSRYAAVTAYFREDRSTLERCINSVRAQTVPVDHILIADGVPQDWIEGEGVRHIRLDRNHSDYGNTPRSIGAALAIAEGYEAFSFLDADNWLEPNHFAYCVDLGSGKSKFDFVVALRKFLRPDGSLMSVVDRNPNVVDTNCFFFLPRSYYAVPRFGQVPRGLAGMGDVVFWQFLRSQPLQGMRAYLPTVNYTCMWAETYNFIGETPPSGSRSLRTISADAKKWLSGLTPEQMVTFSRMIGFDIRQLYFL